ncbi:MAG: NnrS family protein [Campylobacterota bacterium]
MQFSEESDNHYFFSQPHQPFFVLAFVNAIITMFIFLLSYKGVLNLSITDASFHAYGLTYLLFTPAFLAFLFTTFPRFASTPQIEKKVYMRVFTLFYMGSALFALGSIASPVLSALGMFLIFYGHLYGLYILNQIYTTTTMEDKHDIFWINMAMKFGVLAHFVYISGQMFYTPLVGLSTEIAIYLYLFLLTFSVAQRMVPFFSHSMEGRNDYLLKVVFTLLLLHVALEGVYTHSSFVVDILIGLLIGKELFRWKLQFPNPNMLLWVLHTALYWIPVAFILGGLTNLVSLLSGMSFLGLEIHMLTLGFVFTILIGFGTRVTLGHSGNMMQADRWSKYLFYTTQVVVVMRILVSLVAAFGWNFMILFDITATVWIVLLVVWAVRFFPVLISGKKLTD